jgi:hypothetical protein
MKILIYHGLILGSLSLAFADEPAATNVDMRQDAKEIRQDNKEPAPKN